MDGPYGDNKALGKLGIRYWLPMSSISTNPEADHSVNGCGG